jgi:hypothetical protein
LATGQGGWRNRWSLVSGSMYEFTIEESDDAEAGFYLTCRGKHQE